MPSPSEQPGELGELELAPRERCPCLLLGTSSGNPTIDWWDCHRHADPQLTRSFHVSFSQKDDICGILWLTLQ